MCKLTDRQIHLQYFNLSTATNPKREEMLQVQQIAVAYLNQFHSRMKIKKQNSATTHEVSFPKAIMCFIVCL
jgi:hypothetical protein